MRESLLKELEATAFLDAGSSSYVEDLYEQYIKDPKSVDEKWQNYFAKLKQESQSSEIPHSEVRAAFQSLAQQATGIGVLSDESSALARVKSLINSYRYLGHFEAELDPLKRPRNHKMAELTPEYHGLTVSDLEMSFTIEGLNTQSSKLKDIIGIMRKTYCGHIASEYMYIVDQQEREWIQKRLETVHAQPELNREEKHRILERLTAAEGLEKYLGLKYVGQKRFSLEGGESLIPLLDEMIQRAGSKSAREVILGMAHRGRLNALINLLGKSPEQLFGEFEQSVAVHGSGDVKYHKGFSSDVETAGGPVHLALAFNPSHLEIVSPVAAGSVRARQMRRGDGQRNQVLSIQVHGDAAFAGQGVVMETFAMSHTRGYNIGGTIHVVINNQVGFTTDPRCSRSGEYCTDIAKMSSAPVFHVNGDDPEAVFFVAQLALDYRLTFNKDVVIDMVCYRRHGHNESDEPSATQPLMYKVIRKQTTTRKMYAEALMQSGEFERADVDKINKDYRAALEAGRVVAPGVIEGVNLRDHAADWGPYIGNDWDTPYDNSLPKEKLQALAKRMEQLPEDFKLQPQVKKTLDKRGQMTLGQEPIDWGYAENLAYASLLVEDFDVRLAGQDCGRGTFSHRHAALHNQENDATYYPLEHLADKQGKFIVIDSLLSEEAVLAYEYGHATAEPLAMTIWEAQFGDFANGAQVVFDQFISSGEQKWGRLCGLTVLLPHGFEGQGPEHSSARLERFLQLSAQHNIQVCVPTTPGQIYHLIRRQMVRKCRKPLIVMTPKSLLRSPLAVSSLDDLAHGHYHNIIPEIDDLDAKQVNRVVLCSGKVYYDLLSKRRNSDQKDVAIIRIEQLYPFPEAELEKVLAHYGHVKDFIWCQEEPRNQGAWYQSQHHIRTVIGDDRKLHYAGRPAMAAPAEGYPKVHAIEQERLVCDALNLVKV
ncbi:2-oxoglutarate dehydrogenase subunit E1 [Piscirickettsia salmonis]|uniref:2-oxoglutarate dehydrogenase E1 component n=1 Tax=Piscirickettsia salmonis TaxID=1238 RepID=A0A9Q6LS19_PISSA|nr:2-oxoglutarate dehydrogenase E1 component [Piscirickettsia salmonis]ALA26122.1 2-oxoglutarate dehydrogenase [Piscirickettsia salmonis]APS43571.1 2-oxoglutarate dehydrogenase subunit E1 [Piscirickettsia salmonis]APS46924.1 2-oxoglutarate dehydrogenase subunit E1 [Piscirickettsia salmonis]APS51624.1 2-oxoglutarate dehydrogenase subunit E1 [Piscirickettsia salmonis]APS54841.1 2-oxoglutarate dehydrogenase subunit E1 [Piscirickettsia salmonis]